MVDPRAGRFSQGFAAGGNLVQGKFEQEQAAIKQQQDQQNLMREKATKSVAEGLKLLQDSAKNQSAAYFTSKGNNDQKGMETAIAVQTRTAQDIWKSTEEMLKSVGTSEAEIANVKERIRIAASLNNPAAEQRLEETEKTRGAVETAKGKHPLEIEEIQEKGRQARLTRAVPTTQDITTTTNTPKTVSTLQDKLIQTRERKQRLLNIRASFRPELLETWTKMRAKFVAGAEKHLGIEPSEKDKQLITDITNFRGETALGINQTIHDMTGAQMSQFEAKRLRMPEPDVGEKLLEGQSPTEFKANVERAIKDMELADLRFAKLLKEGVITEDDINAKTAGDKAHALIPLKKMEALYEQRGAQILEEVKLLNPKLTDDEAFNMANQKLKAEFTL